MMYLIDSNIFIDHLRGNQKATKFIESVGKSNLYISIVVEMELYNRPIS